MRETTRAHERLCQRDVSGIARAFIGPVGREVTVRVPATTGVHVDPVIHFDGAAWISEQAVAALGKRTVAAVVNLGAGSGQALTSGL